MDSLAPLAKLALRAIHDPSAEQRTLSQAAELLMRRTGAVSVAIVYGQQDGFSSVVVGQDLAFSQDALMYLQQRLVQLRVPLAFNLSDGRVDHITRASNKQRRDYVAWLIPATQSWTEMLVLRGTWAGSAAEPLIDVVDSAIPALAMIVETRLRSSRRDRIEDQMRAITSSVDTLREMAEIVGSVAAVVPARGLPESQSQLLANLADQAERVIAQVESQRELAEAHLKLQQYTLDYTMRLERTVEAERRNATTDALTGLVNHRGSLQLLQTACESSRRDETPLSVIMADVDGFKLFNDTYGHVTGDDVLKVVASVMRETVEGHGTVCRYGGDEFIVILPACEKHQAFAIARAITDRLIAAKFRVEGNRRIPIRASLGVATYPGDARTPADVVSLADAAMYAAKKQVRPSGNVIASITDHTTFAVLDSLVQAIDAKDRYTRAHCDIVAEYAVKLASRMGLPGETQRALHIAGLLHDIGKLVVPDEILKKPAPLTLEEYEVLQRHVKVGEVLIHEVPQLNEVTQAVACHHERFDGTGYPRGLKGGAIPLIGRVIAIADSYSAMRLDRPYRKGIGQDRVLSEIVAGAGTQFDPDIAKIFVELLLEEDVLGRHEQTRAA